MTPIDIAITCDFMCPWRWIGYQSLPSIQVSGRSGKSVDAWAAIGSRISYNIVCNETWRNERAYGCDI